MSGLMETLFRIESMDCPGIPRNPSKRFGRNRLFGPLASLLLGLLTLLPLTPLAAEIEVSLDRNPVPLDESFTLTFSAREQPDDDPDFSPLNDDFEIISQSQGSQFSLQNGQANRMITWKIGVVARKAGTLEIPAIAFGQDRSRPFSVTVTHGAVQGKTGGGADLFIEMEAEPKNPYVQAQVILKVRVLSRVAFSGNLSQPEVAGAVLEKLEDDREYTTLREGMQFKVDERRYALFPQKSGPLRIEPVNLTARLGDSGRSMFDPFLRRAGKTQRLHSDAVRLEVRPIPDQFSGSTWLPAASLDLSERWSDDSLKVLAGDPITRNLTIRAAGVTAGLLPELDPLPDSPADIKSYSDQPTLDEEKRDSGFLSTRTQKTAFIASRPGVYPLPAIEVPWWNTRTERMEIARLPERSVTVVAASTTQAPPSGTPEPAVPKSKGSARDEETLARPDVEAVAVEPVEGLWFWLALLFGLGWLATLLAGAIFYRRKGKGRLPSDSPQPPVRPSEQSLIEAVKKASCANNPAATRQALNAWAALLWPETPMEDLEQRLGGVLGREIGLLNRSLYAPSAEGWRGTALWESFRDHLEGHHPDAPDSADKASRLESLHRL